MLRQNNQEFFTCPEVSDIDTQSNNQFIMLQNPRKDQIGSGSGFYRGHSPLKTLNKYMVLLIKLD